MTPLQSPTAARTAELAAEMSKANPSNLPETAPRKRIPMALPTLKLEVPAIPGYVTHWFRGSQQRINQARNAGYTFVERGEVELNGVGLANDYLSDNNSDLGSRVSVSSGSEDDAGATRLYLMKIPKELWLEDQQALDEQHEQIAAQLRGDKGIAEAGMDASNRYSKGENKTMFHKRRA